MKSTLSASYRSDLAQQCVKCGLCLPHCPTYAIAQNEAESPRGRIALMSALAQSPNSLGFAAQESLDTCLGCRRCETVCPAHVSYSELLISTRAVIKPKLPIRAKTALWLMAHKSWLNAGLAIYRLISGVLPKQFKILPKPEAKTPFPAAVSRTALFSGCVADAYEQNARAALQRLLNAAGEAVEIPKAQVCCGQAALHAGNSQSAAQLAAKNLQAFAGYEQLLVLASGCFSALEQSAGIPVLDACEFLYARRQGLSFKSAQGLRIALHMPCTASFHRQQASLALLKLIPDLHITELADQGCCGAAGLHQLVQPDRAQRLGQPIADAAISGGASLLLSQNIGCRLHLAQDTRLRVQHPLEFMAQFLNDT